MKVLAIGNSFSDDSVEYLYPVLKALGAEDIDIGNLYIGGCEIERHVKDARSGLAEYEYRVNTTGEWVTTMEYPSKPAIQSKAWEVISMQQASHDSGRPETYALLPELIAYVRQNEQGKAKLAWNMTWAYQGDTTHFGFANYAHSQQQMYESILRAVKECVMATGEFVMLFPVGTAVQNARTSYMGDTLTRDGFHLSIPFGRYMASLVWGRVLTGKSVVGIDYAPEGVDEQMKAVAIEAVENAVANPFEVTQSKFV